MTPKKYTITSKEAKEISESIQRAKKGYIYFEENRDRWSRLKYDKQFIAVFSKKFIAADPDLEKLGEKIDKKGKSRNECVIIFFEENPLPLILVVVKSPICLGHMIEAFFIYIIRETPFFGVFLGVLFCSRWADGLTSKIAFIHMKGMRFSLYVNNTSF